MKALYCFLTVLLFAFGASANMKKGHELCDAMRKLWTDHVVYTRNYIISDLGGLKDKDAVTARLLKNQDDIGNAVKAYYGVEAGDKLAKLLREHIMIAAEVVSAAKTGDKTKLNDANKKWEKNGDDIAAFLSSANPKNWSKQDLLSMLKKHLDLTTGEVTSRLSGKWEQDVKFYDEGYDHMLMFADALTKGIVAQFPDKFEKMHKDGKGEHKHKH